MHKNIKVTKLHSKTPTNWEPVGNTLSSGPVVHPREARLVSQAFQANDLHRIDVLRMVDGFLRKSGGNHCVFVLQVVTIVILCNSRISYGFSMVSMFSLSILQFNWACVG